MKQIGLIFLLLLLAPPAWSQPHPAQFPFDRKFVSASLNGQSMSFSATLVVERRGSGAVVAAGRLTCNSWKAQVRFGEDGKFVPFDEFTTLVECGKEQEDFESLFMAAIAKVARWRVEQNDLILEGDETSLRFIPEEASLRK